MPWLTSPSAHPSSLARESRPVAARNSTGAWPRLPPATRAVSDSQIQPSEAPPNEPSGSHRPASHSTNVSACSPSRLTSATITLMWRSLPPTTLPARPSPASTMRATIASSTHGAHWRARCSSGCRPMRSPSCSARSMIWPRPPVLRDAAVRITGASSSEPPCSVQRIASVISASGKAGAAGSRSAFAVLVNRVPLPMSADERAHTVRERANYAATPRGSPGMSPRAGTRNGAASGPVPARNKLRWRVRGLSEGRRTKAQRQRPRPDRRCR
jgi:hypothetical protein